MIKKVPNYHAGKSEGLSVFGESLVDLSAFQESKMNSILAKYRVSGMMPRVQRPELPYDPDEAPVEGDFSYAQEVVTNFDFESVLESQLVPQTVQAGVGTVTQPSDETDGAPRAHASKVLDNKSAE